MNWTVRQIGKILFGRKFSQKFFSKLQLFTYYAQNLGGGADIKSSGESKVLELISSTFKDDKEMIIVDCGANIGTYVKTVFENINVSLKIYALEPVKDTFEQLKNNTSNLKNVVLCNYGLGFKTENVQIFKSKVDNKHASVFQRDMSHWGENMNLTEVEEINLFSLNDFFEKQKIDNIHLLKIDAEGNEFAILSGAKKLILEEKINFIQFEFGVCNVDSRVFFKDFYYLLNINYKIFRILNHGLIEITKYDERNEVFMTTNYIAISKNWLNKNEFENLK